MVFPTLLFTGLNPISANASSSVILVPGGTASAWVYRKDLPIRGRMLHALLGVCILGGFIGSQLLLMTPSQRFARAAPYLMILLLLFTRFRGSWRGSRLVPRGDVRTRACCSRCNLPSRSMEGTSAPGWVLS